MGLSRHGDECRWPWDPETMQQLTDDVYRLQKTTQANGYLVQLGDRSIVIDTGTASGAEGLIAELREAHQLQRISDIVLTHYDPDHAGSAAALQRETGAPVWIGRLDADILRGATPPTSTRRLMARLGRADVPADLRELPVDAETEIAPGLVAVPAPGHTPGHLMLTYRGVAFVGDAVLIRKGRLRQMPGLLISDKQDARETQRLIEALNPRLVCPGHGAPDRLAAV